MGREGSLGNSFFMIISASAIYCIKITFSCLNGISVSNKTDNQ